MLPRIRAADDGVGFVWTQPDGTPCALAELAELPGAEMHRWLPTHLSAVDELLIEFAGAYGEVLGGGRRPREQERAGLTQGYVAIDRASVEYARAAELTAARTDLRAGQILGTGALMSIKARAALGIIGPAPFDGSLDQPPLGVVSGMARLRWVSETDRWRGARWLIETEAGHRLPATLSMLLQDSSGVDTAASVTEHREALVAVAAAVTSTGQAQQADSGVASGALDWLLYDWLMAHRDGVDSGAVEIKSGLAQDARMIVTAAAASVDVRRRFDPALASHS